MCISANVIHEADAPTVACPPNRTRMKEKRQGGGRQNNNQRNNETESVFFFFNMREIKTIKKNMKRAGMNREKMKEKK